MPPVDNFEQKKVDPRIYLGILVFRWKLIVICFLYALVGAVLYLELAPKEYEASAQIMIYRDPSTQIDTVSDRESMGMLRTAMLENEGFQQGVIETLAPRWLKRIGGDVRQLKLDLVVKESSNRMRRARDASETFVSLMVRSIHPAYAKAYLRETIRQFQERREVFKQESYGSAAKLIEEELARIKEQIQQAEDDVIEFQRINQMEYVQLKGAFELGYLNQLMTRQQQLNTEKWMLEVQNPKLKGMSADAIRSAMTLTRETGRVGVAMEGDAQGRMGSNVMTAVTAVPVAFDAEDKVAEQKREEMQFRLKRLEQQRAESAVHMQPENPKLRALDEEIKTIRQDLALQATMEFSKVEDRSLAINMQLDALEEAQRRWRNSYLMASKKGADLRNLQMIVTRLEGMYDILYKRLNELRIDQEIKGERFSVVQPVKTGEKPVWPDPVKILLVALIGGLGAGFGLAMVSFFFDDKVQSVTDVEGTIGVPFLGGVPFWVHSDLVNRIRPIVSDEHRSGAAEAYRALRTNVMSAVEKAGKKVVLVTSADSKEGKTLTSLNLAIMIAKTGKRVLLLDMDLRRGVLHKSFELDRTPGIVDALRDKNPLSSVIRKTSSDSLWFASAGTVDKNTSELLHAVNLETFFGEVLNDYDYILMDTAPVLRVTDTVILAGCPLACVIYVAHANRTSKPVIRYSLDMLGDVHVIGMIVNSIEMHRISSLYYAYQYPNYAYYSYAYRYGYNYDLYDEHGRKVTYGPFTTMRRSIARWARHTFMPVE